MLWHQNFECQTTPTEFWCHGISGAKLHFADVAPLLEFGTKSLAPRLPVNEARGAKDTLAILFWGVMHKRFGVITSWDFCYDLKSLLSNVEQFKPLRFGTDSDSGPRCQDTILGMQKLKFSLRLHLNNPMIHLSQELTHLEVGRTA
ncbi:hypothetical protein Tco_1459896 [Tanacetum coccineum]